MIDAVQVFVIIIAAPLLQGLINRIRARLQGKPGPSVWQLYRDLRKLWAKQAIVAHACAITVATPGIVLGVAVTFAAIVPSVLGASASWRMDAVALALLLALGRFALILAALESRSAFEGMAAGREIAFAALTEAPLILALLAAGGGIGGALSAGALLLVMLCETARAPVDSQQTHYELTMIHEGLVLEYSGWQLAMLQYAAYVRQAAFFVLVALLLPGNTGIRVLWIAGMILLVPTIEAAYAKLRLFQVPQLFTSALILSVASLGLRIFGVLQ